MTYASSHNSKITWQVTAATQGMTLQVFIQQQLGSAWSNKAIKRAIDSRACTVNGKLERFAQRPLWSGDTVVWQAPTPISKVKASPAIIYEDADLLVCDKPAGIVTELDAITAYLASSQPLWLVHRLDRETTGLLLVAKSAHVQQLLESQFKERAVEKVYLALTQGSPKPSQGYISNYLVPKGSYQGQTYWGVGESSHNKARHAATSWYTLANANGCAVVKCLPQTGRTHQLRVHLSHLGAPILGDYQYGQGLSANAASRCMLHAWKLTFKHPSTQRQLQLHCSPPKDWLAVWQAYGGTELPLSRY
jgi:23S rRNA pseudouridine955/2504/2580 synthase